MLTMTTPTDKIMAPGIGAPEILLDDCDVLRVVCRVHLILHP